MGGFAPHGTQGTAPSSRAALAKPGLGKTQQPSSQGEQRWGGALKKGGFGAPSPELGKGCQMEAFNDCM